MIKNGDKERTRGNEYIQERLRFCGKQKSYFANLSKFYKASAKVGKETSWYTEILRKVLVKSFIKD